MRSILLAAMGLAVLGAPAAFAKAKTAPAPMAAAGEPLSAALPTYASFQADISLVNGGSIQQPKDIERALDKAAALNRDALTRGFIAYGAMAAARNQTFVESVRKTAAFYGHDKMVNGLLLSPKYAEGLEGGAQATASVVRLAAADSNRILAAGEAVKQRAREAQTLSWGKANAGSAAPRTQRLKDLANGAGVPIVAPELADRLKVAAGSGDPTIDPTSFGGDAFWRTISDPPSDPTATAAANSATLVSLPSSAPGAWTARSGGADIRSRMVTLAALYALNATMDRPAETERLLNDRITNGCLQGAQLQLYQCVASAKFNYENMACIGEAGLITVSGCIKDVAR